MKIKHMSTHIPRASEIEKIEKKKKKGKTHLPIKVFSIFLPARCVTCFPVTERRILLVSRVHYLIMEK